MDLIASKKLDKVKSKKVYAEEGSARKKQKSLEKNKISKIMKHPKAKNLSKTKNKTMKKNPHLAEKKNLILESLNDSGKVPLVILKRDSMDSQKDLKSKSKIVHSKDIDNAEDKKRVKNKSIDVPSKLAKKQKIKSFPKGKSSFMKDVDMSSRRAKETTEKGVGITRETEDLDSEVNRTDGVIKTGQKIINIQHRKKSKDVSMIDKKKDKIERKTTLETKTTSKSSENIENFENNKLVIEKKDEHKSDVKETKKRKISDEDGNKDIQTEMTIENLGLTKKRIVKFINAILKLDQENVKQKERLFADEKSPFFLTIVPIKIPVTPTFQMRIELPHSLYTERDDVALFVADLKKGRKRDFEETVNHYGDILKENNCQKIKAVIPLNQIKNEYRQFEMRRKLYNLYDCFLVDGRIAGHMCHLLGKMFRNKKSPIPIHMGSKDLNAEVERALTKTDLLIHGRGDTHSVEVGKGSMEPEHVADNILVVIKYLSKNYPGGLRNIRSLRLKTSLGTAIPLYITLKNANEVKTPVVPPKRPKAFEKAEGELSTFDRNVKVVVYPQGNIKVRDPVGAKLRKKHLKQAKKNKTAKNLIIEVNKKKAKKTVCLNESDEELGNRNKEKQKKRIKNNQLEENIGHEDLSDKDYNEETQEDDEL